MLDTEREQSAESSTPVKPWAPFILRTLLLATLDGFAEEYYGASSRSCRAGAIFRTLSREEKIKITRALREEATDAASYEWTMRGIR